MAFYDLTILERDKKYEEIYRELLFPIKQSEGYALRTYLVSADLNKRRAACVVVDRMYKEGDPLAAKILSVLSELLNDENIRVRQSVMDCCGEISLTDFDAVKRLIERGLNDVHSYVKKSAAVTLKGAVKKSPKPVLEFIKVNLKNKDPEVRSRLLHGMETRGKRHPDDILPLLRLMQNEKTKSVCTTVAHVFGQIGLKKAGFEKSVNELLSWQNKELAESCFTEILHGHDRPADERKNKKILSVEGCAEYISKQIEKYNQQ